MKDKMLRLIAVLAFIVASLFAAGTTNLVAAAPKDTQEITAPNGSSADFTGEGTDFFTSIIRDPVDFSNPEDMNWPAGYQSQSMANGQFSGVTNAGDSNFFILFPGFDIAANGMDERNGEVFQVDPSYYNHLVFKYTASANTATVVHWMSPGDPYRRAVGNSDIYQLQAGTGIIDIDMNKRANGGGAGALWTAERWGGLRLAPAFGTPGVSISVDWVRLVSDQGGPGQKMTWNCPGCSGNADIYADLDNNPNNGGQIKLASDVALNSGHFSAPVSKLGPGSYYLLTKTAAGATMYSPGTFSVRPAPILKVTAPSTSSGEDFATAMLNKPWSMTDPSTIAGTSNIINFSVGNGIAQGTATNGDPVVQLLDAPRIAGTPLINSAKYKYLNFSLFLQRPGDTVFNVARILWYNTPTEGNVTGDIVNWHNYWQNYTFDLSKTKMAATTTGWNGTVGVLRIDPHEDPLPPYFQLGPVKLTADPTVAQGNSTAIRWDVQRGSGNVSLYYDRERNFSGTLITANIPAANGGYNWNVGNLATGTYWIRTVINDGANIMQYYGNAPLIVIPNGAVGVPQISNPDGLGEVVTEGDDFFTQVVHDPIDFRNPEDVFGANGWASQSMNDGVWSGVPAAGDANFFALYPGLDNQPLSGRGQQFQIDPNHYNHLVFKYTASAATSAVVYWMSPGDPYRHRLGNSDIIQLPAGTNIIDMDLNKRANGGSSGAVWTTEFWGGLRFSPAFGTPGVHVDLHWLRLTPDNAAPTVRTNWSCQSCLTSAFDIYADTDRNPNNGGMIKLMSSANSAQGFGDVPVGKLGPGSYYMAAVSPGNPTNYSPGTFSVLSSNGYADVPASNTFATYINDLAHRGVVEGYDNNTFRPFESATRGTLARWIVRAKGWSYDTTGAPHFSDVLPTHPDYLYIETAYNHGVLSGYDDHTFRPSNTVTRGQMSKMLVNAMSWTSNVSGGPHFQDVSNSNPFYAQIETIYTRGLVSGYDAPGGFEFRWGNTLTRGQLSKVIANALTQ